ncbi:hypothetical protein Ddye_001030 [Dipteronia dyeriana]|uniref:Protein FAR1-RELATED SEQUENCE n=1 Tax=Dipteronia dyeriana TaxID=168575 RepID=A0AAE0CT47_9ROSI|nr:hypothetical protein Ddye_001030 [Dipteronia dyeriana]
MATIDSELECLNKLDWQPRCGMEFEYEQSAYEFYYLYGRKMGLSIRKDTFRKNRRTGEITSRIFVCSKEGSRSKDKHDVLTIKPRVETRTSCGAQMSFKIDRNKNKFYVNHFVEMHNHPFVRQECTHMLPSQLKISVTQAIEVDLVEESRISLKSSYELFGRQAGGRDSLGYTKRDQKNYLRSKRQNKLAYGETDAKMIIDYGQFGDVLSFDTTYKINKENRPFVVFVGLNHHRETVIFGGALMNDETIDSFVWLFETFLQAMSRRTPKTIFTDQDVVMAKAILHVMPSTYHRLCTWHMMQNALKHVYGLFRGEVKNVLSGFFYEIEDESDFLMAWNHMLDEYNVHENTWLKSIFDLKEKWAYPYVRHAWSAGMKSTQLSESYNATLKEYLKSDLNVSQFFMHFERVVNDKRYKELEAEYDLLYMLVNVKINAKMLIQAREVFTKAIFLEFNMNLNKERHVKMDTHNTLSYSCRMFEMKGVLCSHVIKILRDALNINEIPTQYILKRWTKQARVECVQDMHRREIQEDPELQQTYQYRPLCSIFTRISSRASESEKTYILVTEQASKILLSQKGKQGTHPEPKTRRRTITSTTKENQRATDPKK